MGIPVAQQLNKPVPGLKTKLNSSSNIPDFDVKSSASGKTTTPSSKTSNNLKSSALFELNKQTTRQTLQTGSSDPNYVGGMRNVRPSDYKMNNVEVGIGKYSSTPFAQTRRSENRDIARLNEQMEKYAQYNSRFNNNNYNKPADTMAVLTQLGGLLGQGVKAVTSTNGGTTQSVAQSVASAVSGGAAVFSADYSSGYGEQIASEKTLQASEEELSESLGLNIDENTKTLGAKTETLSGVNNSISTLNQQIDSLEKTMGKNPDPAAVAANQTRLSTLKAELVTKKKEQEALQTEIKNIKEEIARDTASKKDSDKEIEKYKSNIQQYESKQAKLEKSEQKEMKNSNDQLTKLAQKLSNETDDAKKAKLVEEYKGIAKSFNTTIDKTSASHSYQKVNEEPNVPTFASVNQKMQNALNA